MRRPLCVFDAVDSVRMACAVSTPLTPESAPEARAARIISPPVPMEGLSASARVGKTRKTSYEIRFFLLLFPTCYAIIFPVSEGDPDVASA